MADERKANAAPTIWTALIAAISAVVVAWITAGGVAAKRTTDTIYTSGSALSELRKQTATIEASLAKLHSDQDSQRTVLALQAQEAQAAVAQMQQVAGSICPMALTAENSGTIRTFADTTEGAASDRELVSISGPGCVIAGGVFGYYVKNSTNGDNYRITIDLDGHQFKYPPQPAVAYAQSSSEQNTGVLVLPPISFRRSLRITYSYAGGGMEVSGYAIVIAL